MIDLVNDEDRREIKNILENDLISMTNLCKHYGVRAKRCVPCASNTTSARSRYWMIANTIVRAILMALL